MVLDTILYIYKSSQESGTLYSLLGVWIGNGIDSSSESSEEDQIVGSMPGQ